jgi:hypothetical protein
MSFSLVSCAQYTLMDFSPIVDLSRSLKTNVIVKFAPLWNVMRSCYKTNNLCLFIVKFVKFLAMIFISSVLMVTRHSCNQPQIPLRIIKKYGNFKRAMSIILMSEIKYCWQIIFFLICFSACQPPFLVKCFETAFLRM